MVGSYQDRKPRHNMSDIPFAFTDLIFILLDKAGESHVYKVQVYNIITVFAIELQ
jgi:hypothetical protein